MELSRKVKCNYIYRLIFVTFLFLNVEAMIRCIDHSVRTDNAIRCPVSRYNDSDGSIGGEGGGVITTSGEARRDDDGVINIGFFGEIYCSRSIFARVFNVEIVLWY